MRLIIAKPSSASARLLIFAKRVLRVATQPGLAKLCGNDYRMRGSMRILGYLLNRPKIPGASDKQIALFTQFAGTIRDNGSELSQQPGNTLLSYERKHHWAWFIPVTEELTSVGVVFRTEYFKQAGLSKEEMRSPISATTPTKKRELFCKSWLDFPAWKKKQAP